MLNQITNVAALIGAIYLSFKIGTRQSKIEERAEVPATTLEVAKSCGVMALAGVGCAVALPVTGPIGLCVLGHDIYKNRQQIKQTVTKPFIVTEKCEDEGCPHYGTNHSHVATPTPVIPPRAPKATKRNNASTATN